MVAMPIYYATGSKWRGFAWAALSACAEPLGGLLGFLVLSYTTFSPLGFAIVFASVAGMMVYISMRELLPTALKYDREDRVTTLSLVWGMAVIAASLLLFSA
jgi:ZIP family zinc transporter